MKTVVRPETEMTDSGIDTVEKMPLSWSKIRLKNLVKIRTGNEDTQNATPNGKYRFYVRSPIVERCDRYTFEGEAILVAGDGAGAGRIFHLVNGRYAVHQRVYCLSDFKYNAKFVHYYLENLFPFEMDKGSAQSTVPSMRLPMLLNFNLVLPGENECLKIVDYLDETCSKIDEIITEAKASIDAYRELKQSVIFEAVTKGLSSSNNTCFNNDIEWADGVCSSWDVSQIRYLYELRKEINEKPLEEVNLISLYTDKGVLQHSDIEKTSGNKAVTAEGYKIVYPNDIVVNIILCWMGAMGRSDYYGVTSPAYDIYKPIDETKVSSRYYHYLFRTDRFAKKCYTVGRGIMMMRWRTYSSEFRSIKVPVPTKTEQEEIADFLDKRTAEIDSLIAEKESLINDLEAYKKSLIYEVVTGKRRVV